MQKVRIAQRLTTVNGVQNGGANGATTPGTRGWGGHPRSEIRKI